MARFLVSELTEKAKTDAVDFVFIVARIIIFEVVLVIDWLELMEELGLLTLLELFDDEDDTVVWMIVSII